MPASDWADLCPHTICWQPITGRDEFAKPTYGTVQTFTGRRVYTQVRVDASGMNASKAEAGTAVDFVSGSIIWILGTPAIGLEDRVYVQGDTSFAPILKDAERFPDEDGDLFVESDDGEGNGMKGLRIILDFEGVAKRLAPCLDWAMQNDLLSEAEAIRLYTEELIKTLRVENAE